jgi:hypothetical protein
MTQLDTQQTPEVEARLKEDLVIGEKEDLVIEEL